MDETFLPRQQVNERNSARHELAPQKNTLVLSLVVIIVLIILLIISAIIIMRLNSYNLFMMNTPKKVPPGFKRVSVEKKIPLEKDWLLKATYENANKQQFMFVEEPHRDISCEQGFWQKNLSVFRPVGSSKGCSFYMDQLKNDKPVRLHWFLWNKGNNAYHIYDQESVLTNQEVTAMAESIGQEIIIAKDLTNKK